MIFKPAVSSVIMSLSQSERDRTTATAINLADASKELGKLENETGLKKTEEVVGEYDLETRLLTRLTIGRAVVYEKKRDGPVTEAGQ